MELVAVAALTDDRVIGRDGEVPWDLPADRTEYRARVGDAPVILGRRTFEAMCDDLPGSAQVVLSRSVDEFDAPTARHAASVEEAIAAVEDEGAPVAYVLGGGSIYELLLPRLDRMVLSRVPGEYDGDTYFPEWDTRTWELVEETPRQGYTLETWARKPAD